MLKRQRKSGSGGVKKSSAKKKNATKSASQAKYPRHSIEQVLRLPKAIIDQNASKPCTDREVAGFLRVGFNGPFSVEIASAIKYGLLSRPERGHVEVTERGRRIIRPQNPDEVTAAAQEAVLAAATISEVYSHYRGENLPDGEFFDNALVDKFALPADKTFEFKEIFFSCLSFAQLSEVRDDKTRLLDIGHDVPSGRSHLKLEVKKASGDSCFVVMPFAHPIGGYYKSIYEPAILSAGLKPVRADNEIFGTGKIIDQIWQGINQARVLVAELTTRNPNVFYELGLAHALRKPVVLVSANQEDVPFDLQHIRVIYYDYLDPFWGEKLKEKVAENILSALANPDEAIFDRALNYKQ